MNQEDQRAIQDDYPDDFAWCYGCGRNNNEGIHVKTYWEGDQTVSSVLPDKKYTALPGFVYGGFLASFVDCHGTGSASLALHRKKGHQPGDGVEAPRFVTASLHVDYLKPTPQGITLKATSQVEEIHPKKFRVKTQIHAGDQHVANGEVVAVVMPDTFIKDKD
ncbi:PaaI family thioesterase [Rummeliibacillus sp. G93]|uniref:PaaI family thioesterase n=1 Tax=Rummeliibacillus sp. G93 TaxID=2939494 RepID=UPI00201C3836|nr:PaaI family thioesterase [Rummeliibacillus sp. G93]UQW97587.1 PaaI family thioesterase [Rummeliibacillus sp. G93]